MRRRLRDQDGFSLIELQVAELIGGVVVTAAISMMIIAVNSAQRVSDRVNAAATGRSGMEQIQQQLRSQTCMFPGEYSVNGTTPPTGAVASIVHAADGKLVYFGDLGATGAGTTGSGAVAFQPQLRYLYAVNPGATGGSEARKATIVEGFRSSADTTAPFDFSIAPAASLAQLASATTINSVNPTQRRLVLDGVTNMVSETAAVGATGPTVAYFRYFDANDTQITPSAAIGAVSSDNLPLIARVTVGFKVLGAGFKDDSRDSGSTATASDKRTAVFKNDIYLRTVVDRCQ
ncbi:MAG: hypothetical protein WAO61_07055 [Solirubrobacterales bacterium]